MGNTKPNSPVVGAAPTTPPPAANPLPEDLLVLSRLLEFVLVAHNHLLVVLAWLFPETFTADSDSNVPRQRRGARQALVATSPPLFPQFQAVRMMPTQCQRRLVFVISAFCSSVVVILLSSLMGPATRPSLVAPVDLPVDLSCILDILNENVGHVPRNVAAASMGACLLQVGSKLVELAQEMNCDPSNSALTGTL